jgi:peptidoglycan/LPS O-acetylase OafA/YrhL
LLFPALVVASMRFSHRVLVLAVSLIALASFGLAELRWGLNEDGAFYLIFTRAWELATGALVALMPAPRKRLGSDLVILNLLVVLALLGILTCAVVYSESTHFPGWSAVVPTFGAE